MIGMNKDKIVKLRDDEPEDFEVKSFTITDHLDQTAGNGVWQSESQAFLDNTNLKALFFNEDWVYIVVDLVASEISKLKLNVMKRTIDENGEETVEPALDHPLQALIEKPNKWQDYTSFIYNLMVELHLMGNGVIWFSKKNVFCR